MVLPLVVVAPARLETLTRSYTDSSSISELKVGPVGRHCRDQFEGGEGVAA